jgi:hypothetical protein
MNKDQINLQEAYSRIYHKTDEDFEDQVNPSAQERAESVYGEEIPPVEGEDEEWGEGSDDTLPPASYPVDEDEDENEGDEDLTEKKEKFTINTPTQGQLISKMRSPVHKPTMQIKPKKGIYNRQQFKNNYE